MRGLDDPVPVSMREGLCFVHLKVKISKSNGVPTLTPSSLSIIFRAARGARGERGERGARGLGSLTSALASLRSDCLSKRADTQ